MSPSHALIIFPLLAAILFAVASLALKRSSQLGVSVWQTAFVVNMMNAGCYSWLWFMGGEPVSWEMLWQPGLIALCLFSGMATQFIAL